jgi:transposase InsO family protein
MDCRVRRSRARLVLLLLLRWLLEFVRGTAAVSDSRSRSATSSSRIYRPVREKFTNQFDEVFRSQGTEIVRTPLRTPQADGVTERFVRTVRTEWLDWLLILNDQYLERILEVFADYYNGHRPHRALSLAPPVTRRAGVVSASSFGDARILRRDRLGGVVHEYSLAARRGFRTLHLPLLSVPCK